MTIERHPLTWPATWPRTAATARKRASFGSRQRETGKAWTTSKSLTIFAALRRLTDELDRLRATGVVISSNVPVRFDGLPRSDAREPSDPGVACYFRHRGADRVFACDRWDRVADNVAAIAAHIAALRGMERWGVGSIDQAFRGYEALPAPGGTRQRSWRDVLEYGDLPIDAETIARAYRIIARRVHADAGGSHEAMVELNAARDAALRECGR